MVSPRLSDHAVMLRMYVCYHLACLGTCHHVMHACYHLAWASPRLDLASPLRADLPSSPVPRDAMQDGWRRNLTVVPYHNLSARTRPGSVALPFASLIAWEDVIIDADPAQPERLLDTLLAISDDEIVARKAYLARIAPLMLLEVPPDHQGPDHEPQGEFSREGGRAKGSSQAWRGATRAREVGGRASIAPNGVDAFIRELQHVSSGTRPGNH